MLQTRRAGSRRHAAASRTGLAICATAVAVVNYLLADPHQGPRIFADEIGYLANARYLAGGHVIDMSHTAFYAGGFSVAIAPLSWLFRHNPSHLYESVIAMQAVLAGISVVIIAQLCRWLFHARPSVAIAGATVAGIYPAFVFNTGFTWSESMLTFALLLAIGSAAWVFQSLDRNPDPGRVVLTRAAITGALCGYVLTVHNRTLLAMLALVAIIAGALVLRHARRAAVAVAVTFVLVAAAGQVLNKHLNHVLWNGAGSVDTSSRISDLLSPHGVWEASRSAVGQYWYQNVATGGLVVIALTALVLFALRGRRRRGDDRDDRSPAISSRATMAGSIFVVFVALTAVSAVFLENPTRGDAVVYGRYVDVATPLLVAIAITWLGTAPAIRSLAIAAGAVVASSAAWFVLHYGARIELTKPYNRVTTMGIIGWLDPRRTRPMLGLATAWALGIAIAVIAVSYVVRQGFAPWWTGTAIVTIGILCLFGWQLSLSDHEVLAGLAVGSTATRATVAAVHDTGTKELALDPSITVVDRLALAFWLPDVKLSNETPANAACAQVVSISHAPTPVANQERIATVGTFDLFRGLESCSS